MKAYTVDRIENGFAACETETGEIINIALNKLPKDIHEGDCINQLENGEYIVDIAATEKKRAENAKLFESLLDN